MKPTITPEAVSITDFTYTVIGIAIGIIALFVILAILLTLIRNHIEKKKDI